MARTLSPTTNTTLVYSTQSVQNEDEAPKSPPKWPLRPGVLVHVKTDTKENLHAARTQSPNSKAVPIPMVPKINTSNNKDNNKNSSSNINKSSTVNESEQGTIELNESTVSIPVPPPPPQQQMSPPDIPPKNNPFRVSRCDSDSLNNTSKSSNNDELVKFSNSKFLQRILVKLNLRRAGPHIKETNKDEENCDENEDLGDGSSFKRRNDYRFRIQSKASWRGTWDTWAWFGSNKSTRSNKNLVDNNNHITGIECTEKGKEKMF